MPIINLYNSLTRSKELFKPLKDDKVGMYTCGPTVYDSPHVGNMRAYIIWDVLKRFLISQGYKVKHIMNVTDVGHLTSDADAGDDKMEVAKKRERITAWEVADRYFKEFIENIESLNIIAPTDFVRATDLIKEQIEFVKKLEEKGYLYTITDGVYFDTSKDPEYGKLGRLNLMGMISGARVEENVEKKNASDFAVWKFSPKDSKRDMEWDSPWGKGFPGWHLECSVISMEKLGDQFDIHTGGIDHLTVHHPNEIAQSKAVTGRVPAVFWIHNEYVNFKDKKMAKSEGTFVKISDIAAGGVHALAYRYFVLQTHYRKEVIYSWEAIKAAHQGLMNIYKDVSFFDAPDNICESCEEKFFNAMSDDLNTAKALDIFHSLIKSDKPTSEKLASIINMDKVLGLGIEHMWKQRSKVPAVAKKLLKEREQARVNKDWKQSDKIRDKLFDLGVLVNDTKEGQKAALVE